MIPFLDFAEQYKTLGGELESAVVAALQSGKYVLGPSVEAFERCFADYCGMPDAVAVNSGTSALHLSLLAAGVGPGDEVITVSATFVATVAAIVYAGARPVFVDIDPDTWTMDPDRIEALISPRTRAIIPVHLHGRLADMDAILEIARRRNLTVIEDAAQAHGAARSGIRAGAFGDLAAFSFYPGKNLGACGEGGAITTSNPDYSEILRSLRDWGQSGKYNHVRHGFNCRMDGIQGAVLGVKLPYLDRWNEARRQIANDYHAGLSPNISRALGPFGADHACHVYAIRARDRDGVREELARRGVATLMHYPCPVHLQPAYASLGYGSGDLPVTEQLARETLSLPLFPELKPEQVDMIIKAVNRVMSAELAHA